MSKTLINGKLDLTVSSWWTNLTTKERQTLITMLFNMGVEDFEQYGVTCNKDEYVLK